MNEQGHVDRLPIISRDVISYYKVKQKSIEKHRFIEEFLEKFREDQKSLVSFTEQRANNYVEILEKASRDFIRNFEVAYRLGSLECFLLLDKQIKSQPTQYTKEGLPIVNDQILISYIDENARYPNSIKIGYERLKKEQGPLYQFNENNSKIYAEAFAKEIKKFGTPDEKRILNTIYNSGFREVYIIFMLQAEADQLIKKKN